MGENRFLLNKKTRLGGCGDRPNLERKLVCLFLSNICVQQHYIDNTAYAYPLSTKNPKEIWDFLSWWQVRTISCLGFG